MSSKPFGYVYDERMLGHECKYDSTMAECPKRMKLIYERIQADKLFDGALKIDAREAEDAEIRLNHPQQLIDEIISLNTNDKCEEYCKDKEILWTCENTNEAARVAIGGCIELVKAAVEDKIHNGFAIVRPPGHHSYGKVAQGYCIFNNVAIAAKYAIEKLGVKKVAIVDFDYHAGNGTYQSVKDEPRIHFTSFHGHHYGAFWPFSREYDYATNDPTTLFVPLNGAMNSEGDYVSVFHHVLLPMLKQFEPELILISAGFDSGYYDIMMEFGQAVKAHGYGHMARLLNQICPGKTIAILEGGYHPYNYTECASMMVRGLLNLPLPKIKIPSRISGALLETMWNILNHHSKWYPKLEERLELMEIQQKNFGLPPFVFNQTLFLGAKMRMMYDDVKKHRLVRTREWFPEMNAEQIGICKEKIDDYIKKYDFATEHADPNEEQLISQCVWDEASRSDAFMQASPFASCLIQEFNDFVAGKRENMMICDRELYAEAVRNGVLDEHTPITTTKNNH
uniref:Hist_deacetyl domain-containing protein n=1 Tax=Caenorhabditis tropicalis TaxID=1561998 RepID=A0A1I7T148_9PELO